MNIAIDIKDKRILKFDNLQKDTALNITSHPGIGIEHDLEKMDAGEWLVHIDTWFAQPGAAGILTRTSFSLTTGFENIWAEGVAIEYIKSALAVCRLGFNEQCKHQGIDCFIEEGFSTGQNATDCLQLLLNDVHENGLYSDEDKGGYNWNTLKIPSDGQNAIVASVTLMVMDEIFFYNTAFNRNKNIETFNGYIPVRFYSTIKLKLLKLLEKQPIHFSLKQLTIYIFTIRCACTLLLSHHYDSMKEALEKKGVDEELFNQYIKCAAAFLENLKNDFEKMDVTIMNLSEDIDWEALVC